MDTEKIVSLLRSFSLGDEQAIAESRTVTRAGWNELVPQLKLLGLAPVFFSRLADKAPEAGIPGPVLQALQDDYFLHAARNTLILDDLRSLLEALRPRGISAVVLKGACLAGPVYGDIGLRPMQDIDILVRQKDLREVSQVLISMGYGPRERPPVREQCCMHHHLIPFCAPGRAPVEVHWSLTPAGSRFPMTMEDLEDETLPLDINGSEALMLCPGDLLIHLCLHLCANHCFSLLALRNLCDIAQVLLHQGDKIDWKRLGERTRRFGVGKYVYSTLLVAESLCGAALPEEGLAHLDHDEADAEISRIVAGYLLDNGSLQLPGMFDRLNKGDDPLQMPGALIRRLFPPRDYLERKYGIPPSGAASKGSLYLRHWLETLSRGVQLLAHLSVMSGKARATIRRRRQEIIIRHWLDSGGTARP